MPPIRLTRSFDPQSLETAYLAVREAVEATPAGYPGEAHVGWSSICVYSASAGPSPVLDQAPYLRAVLSELKLRLRLARLLRLEPGGVICEHQDSFLSTRIVRLHIPVITHPDVEMYLGGARCAWRAGELWYGDFSQPHSGVNRSPLARIHLVIDVTVDQNLLGLFPPGQLPEGLALLGDDDGGELDQKVLERFALDFTLPAGFQLPGPGYDALTTGTQGSIRLVDSELIVFVNEQPMLKAVPAAEDTLDLPGLGSEARLHYSFEGDALQGVKLTFGARPGLSLDVRASQP